MRFRHLVGAAAFCLACSLLPGCTTAPEAEPDTAVADSSPKQQIVLALEKWRQDILSQDVERMLTSYSEGFQHPELLNKEGLRSYLSEARDADYLRGMEIGIADAQIRVDGEQAVAYPVHVSGGFGSLVYELSFTLEGEHWLITGTKSSGA